MRCTYEIFVCAVTRFYQMLAIPPIFTVHNAEKKRRRCIYYSSWEEWCFSRPGSYLSWEAIRIHICVEYARAGASSCGGSPVRPYLIERQSIISIEVDYSWNLKRFRCQRVMLKHIPRNGTRHTHATSQQRESKHEPPKVR